MVENLREAMKFGLFFLKMYSGGNSKNPSMNLFLIPLDSLQHFLWFILNFVFSLASLILALVKKTLDVFYFLRWGFHSELSVPGKSQRNSNGCVVFSKNFQIEFQQKEKATIRFSLIFLPICVLGTLSKPTWRIFSAKFWQ